LGRRIASQVRRVVERDDAPPRDRVARSGAILVTRNESETFEMRRYWRRVSLSVLEGSPKHYHDIVGWIDEGRSPRVVMNAIDEALDRTPTNATRVSAAAAAFDLMRRLATPQQSGQFVDLVGRVNRNQAPPLDLKRMLLGFALAHHAGELLESTYFDDLRDASAEAD
jgi:hypothetical protein